MKKLTMLLGAAGIALIATAVRYRALPGAWVAVAGITVVAVVLLLAARLTAIRQRGADGPAVGVGTVRTIGGDSGERQVFIEVVAVSGETFIGKLARCDGEADLSMLRPGLVVLVAFDPAAREELSLPDDVLAVHASWAASA